MTKRLREMETKKDGMHVNPQNKLDYIVLQAHIRGYTMALEDLAPVLEAARAVSIHDKWTHENCGCPFPALREALAEVSNE